MPTGSGSVFTTFGRQECPAETGMFPEGPPQNHSNDVQAVLALKQNSVMQNKNLINKYLICILPEGSTEGVGSQFNQDGLDD